MCIKFCAASIAAATIYAAGWIYARKNQLPYDHRSVIWSPLRQGGAVPALSLRRAPSWRPPNAPSSQLAIEIVTVPVRHIPQLTDAAVSHRFPCRVRRRGCCHQQLGIGARCSSRRRACWSARTASEIFRDIQIWQPQRCVAFMDKLHPRPRVSDAGRAARAVVQRLLRGLGLAGLSFGLQAVSSTSQARRDRRRRGGIHVLLLLAVRLRHVGFHQG